MKKLMIIFSLIFACGAPAFSQEFATDFNVADCNGEMHHLFSELDDGKVVIIAWVMPCASCIADPAYTFSLSETYANTVPDKVLFYLADDYADTSCSTLQSWAANYGMGKSTIFSNAEIKMSDYGQDGMPKIVVLGGGGEHKVFYNKNFTSDGIEEAIENAIAQSTAVGLDDMPILSSFEIFPLPVSNILNAVFKLGEPAKISAQILNLNGEVIKNIPIVSYNRGIHNKEIDISELANGSYLFVLRSESALRTMKFNVIH